MTNEDKQGLQRNIQAVRKALDAADSSVIKKKRKRATIEKANKNGYYINMASAFNVGWLKEHAFFGEDASRYDKSPRKRERKRRTKGSPGKTKKKCQLCGKIGHEVKACWQLPGGKFYRPPRTYTGTTTQATTTGATTSGQLAGISTSTILVLAGFP